MFSLLGLRDSPYRISLEVKCKEWGPFGPHRPYAQAGLRALTSFGVSNPARNERALAKVDFAFSCDVHYTACAEAATR